jgi:uncharacterized glyoxalase superfamily protein PhnB
MYEELTPNIMVEDVRKTIEFYKEYLEFEIILTVTEQGEKLNFAIVKKDNISIMFEAKDALIAEYPTLETTTIKATFTLFIVVQNIEELYNNLKNKVRIAKEMHQTFYGKLEFAIFDNNNNILTFACK